MQFEEFLYLTDFINEAVYNMSEGPEAAMSPEECWAHQFELASIMMLMIEDASMNDIPMEEVLGKITTNYVLDRLTGEFPTELRHLMNTYPEKMKFPI